VAVWLARAVVDSDTDLPGGGKQPTSRATSRAMSRQSQAAIFLAIGGGSLG
jgi:hypothetical protein